MRFYLSSLLTIAFLSSAVFSEESIERTPLPPEKIEIKPLPPEKKEIPADENFEKNIREEHSIVQSRSLPDAVQKFMVAKALEEEEEETTDQKDDCGSEIQTGIFANQYPQVFFPYSCHSISAVSTIGDSIALEDGSIWDVHPSAKNEVMSWKESDPLLIYPNRAWFSTYKYKISNQVLKTEVEANMTYGPLVNGEFSLQITAIDPLKNEIYLSDSSRWRICSSDNYLLEQWIVGDYIIVGTNNSWFCSLKNVLINSNMYNHVRAQQY